MGPRPRAPLAATFAVDRGEGEMIFQQFLHPQTGCAAYVFG
jgi:hypothetical protein